jgi:ribose transport system substrate-binding protein
MDLKKGLVMTAHRRRPFLALVLAGLLASSVISVSAACPATEAPKSVRVAFFASSLANTYVPAQLSGAKKAAKRYGASVSVFDALYDATKQVAQVQDAITSKKFDVFVISAVDGNAVVPQIRRAIAAEIRVACISAPCGPNLATLKPQVRGLTVQVGHSFVTSGRQLGEQVFSACASQKPCKVAFLPGLFSYPPDRIRTQSLHAELRGHRSINIVSEQEGKYSAESARAAMQNILQAHKDLNVVATTGDQMAFGAERAVKAAGLTRKVKIIGNGASSVGIAAVKAGRWYATLVLLPFTEGRIATDYAVRAARGATGLPSSVDIEKLSPIGPVATKATVKGFTPEWRG